MRAGLSWRLPLSPAQVAPGRYDAPLRCGALLSQHALELRVLDLRHDARRPRDDGVPLLGPIYPLHERESAQINT